MLLTMQRYKPQRACPQKACPQMEDLIVAAMTRTPEATAARRKMIALHIPPKITI